MLRKGIFILAHQFSHISFYSEYKRILKSQWKTYDELKLDQEKKLRYLIDYAYRNVPYYRNLFKDLNLMPEDIRIINDLEKLPILTKEIIKKHWNELKPINLSSIKYYNIATGGSTGTPMQYRISKNDRFLAGVLLYRGWGYGGFELGDRMVFLAGSSLDIGTKSYLIKRTHEFVRNLKKLSSFDMGEAEMLKYANILNVFHPKFIRGYASSIYFYAKWLDENNIRVPSPDAIFTTSEKLFPNMRNKIEDCFSCDVFDTYGLNDGGVSAYECQEHNGLHIDTERSIMEVVDNTGVQIGDGIGSILATSLNNYAMPFIRYDTGDLGHIVNRKCNCGRGSRLLKEVIGRSVDILLTPEGKSVHGWFFLYIFWRFGDGIKRYQVVQKNPENVLIKIIPGINFNPTVLQEIHEIIKLRSERWNIEFEFVDEIPETSSGKYKFIVREF